MLECSTGEPTVADLVTAAGQIARIVNYYDGPKAPRSLGALPSLNGAVRSFQEVLVGVAHAHRVDLRRAVEGKLAATPARDAGRFEHREHDPATAPQLERFRLARTPALAPEHADARLWGAPAWSLPGFCSNVEAIVAPLMMFSRAAVNERLDAFVVSGPPCGSIELFSEWVERLLGELRRHDPERDEPARGAAGTAGRRFAFGGLPMLVEALSPLYERRDPRHSSTDTFAVLRPERRPLQ